MRRHPFTEWIIYLEIFYFYFKIKHIYVTKIWKYLFSCYILKNIFLIIILFKTAHHLPPNFSEPSLCSPSLTHKSFGLTEHHSLQLLYHPTIPLWHWPWQLCNTLNHCGLLIRSWRNGTTLLKICTKESSGTSLLSSSNSSLLLQSFRYVLPSFSIPIFNSYFCSQNVVWFGFRVPIFYFLFSFYLIVSWIETMLWRSWGGRGLLGGRTLTSWEIRVFWCKCLLHLIIVYLYPLAPVWFWRKRIKMIPERS